MPGSGITPKLVEVAKYALCSKDVEDRQALLALERWCKVATGPHVYTLLSMETLDGRSIHMNAADLDDDRRRPALNSASEPKLLIPACVRCPLAMRPFPHLIAPC